jgi:indolepyruvate ferredoxin oxidoreductase alpha subunit
MSILVSTEVGHRELLLGNEAIVRGALEAGVGLVTGYPGTPASEIGDTFAELHRQLGIRFEYSINEKVALELAYGAALTGVRTLTSMKHLGLTYAGDPLSTMPYIGVVGGMVIVSAADPGCLTSPNEQDQRHFGRMLGLPTLDPATPEEARQMTVFAFELSEACELPVLLRITTRVCHTRAPVQFGALSKVKSNGEFKKNPRRFIPTPNNARVLRETLEERLSTACTMLTKSPFNRVLNRAFDSRRALVSAGAPRNVVQAVLEKLDVALPVLELGALHPLPHETIVEFLKRYDEVLIVEELSPYVEDSLLAIAHHYGLATRIHGKRDGKMPWPFELELHEVERRVRSFLSLDDAAALGQAAAPPDEAEAVSLKRATLDLPVRAPVLCAGCLHRNVFFAATAVFGEKATYVNDIGCYTLGASEPYRAGDVLLAMGSSVPMASGIARTTGQRVIAFLGDSTFFHSGIPGLVNAIEQADDVVVVILDNHVTAMTGFQPNPTTPGAKQAGRIPAVVRALGAAHVESVDAADVAETMKAIGRAKEAKGVAVVIAEGPCAAWQIKQNGRSQTPAPEVDASLCHTCGMAEAGLHCELPPTRKIQKQLAVQHLGLRRNEVPVRGGGALVSTSAVLPGNGLGQHSARLMAPEGPSSAHPTRLATEIPRTSPCSLECPLGICIPAYIGAIAADEPERAFAAVELRAALPSVCSHICHRPCESSCVVAQAGEAPVAINALKRYLTERVERGAPRFGNEASPSAHSASSAPARVAIIGAGPAGLAAARELVRRGYAPTLFEARQRAGGMLEYAVPDYRLPRAVLRKEIDALVGSGMRLESGKRLGRDVSLDDLRKRGFKAVLLALGAQRGVRPKLEGVGWKGVGEALPFLESPPSCAGEAVLILGGGDVAIDVARTAMRLGASSARLVFPEPRAEMAAAPDAVALAMSEGVTLTPGSVALGFVADERGRVVSARLGTVIGFERVTALDGRSRARWGGTTSEATAVASRVVLATGQSSDLAGLDLPDSVVTPEGWLAADENGRTVVPWLFAAGDIVSGPSTVTAAMAAAVRSAWAIDTYLSEGTREVAKPAAPPPRRRVSHSDRTSALLEGVVLSRAEATVAAERCQLCGLCQNCNTCVEVLACPAITREGGRPRVLKELCVSCEACVQTCPNGALKSPEVRI